MTRFVNLVLYLFWKLAHIEILRLKVVNFFKKTPYVFHGAGNPHAPLRLRIKLGSCVEGQRERSKLAPLHLEGGSFQCLLVGPISGITTDLQMMELSSHKKMGLIVPC